MLTLILLILFLGGGNITNHQIGCELVLSSIIANYSVTGRGEVISAIRHLTPCADTADTATP